MPHIRYEVELLYFVKSCNFSDNERKLSIISLLGGAVTKDWLSSRHNNSLNP
jgi:hypothetical protein